MGNTLRGRNSLVLLITPLTGRVTPREILLPRRFALDRLFCSLMQSPLRFGTPASDLDMGTDKRFGGPMRSRDRRPLPTPLYLVGEGGGGILCDDDPWAYCGER